MNGLVGRQSDLPRARIAGRKAGAVEIFKMTVTANGGRPGVFFSCGFF